MRGKSLSKYLPTQLLQPIHFFHTYQLENLRPDLVAGLTVAVILLPQAIAFTLIAELPAATGLYAAVIAAIVGGLWASTNQIHTGPANAVSLLVASALLVSASPDTQTYILAAGILAVMAGLFQLTLGLARLGILVNFVSRSVIIGFTAGAGILIAVKQLSPLMGVEVTGQNLLQILPQVASKIPQANIPTFLIGAGTILLILIIRAFNPKLPDALIAMSLASLAVFVFNLSPAGVNVVGVLPRSLPPLADLPVLDLDLIANLSTGALAVGAIGLVQTAAISRSIATKTGQRVDNNQEFVSQGLANIATGVFSGYPVTASFTRSAVNHESGARTNLAAIFSGVFVLLAMIALAPLAGYLPLSALAGVLIIIAVNLIDYREILRVLRGTREDAIIMIITFLGTLFLRIDFAVLTGILVSFAFYIINTSAPRVRWVIPDANFKHFVHKPEEPQCPQLGVMEIQGDLYFGAVEHVEESILDHIENHPTQRFLLLRMHRVNQIDFSGIQMLETIVDACRARRGGVYMVKVRNEVVDFMKTTGFYNYLGADHFLDVDNAIEHLFYKVLDPAICIYESNVRIFEECQNLARPDYTIEISTSEIPEIDVQSVAPEALWNNLQQEPRPLIIDVREPREYQRAHIPQAEMMPLPAILSDQHELPRDRQIVLVCRSGRRSTRAAQYLADKGHGNVAVLQGGILNWEAKDFLQAVE